MPKFGTRGSVRAPPIFLTKKMRLGHKRVHFSTHNPPEKISDAIHKRRMTNFSNSGKRVLSGSAVAVVTPESSYCLLSQPAVWLSAAGTFYAR